MSTAPPPIVTRPGIVTLLAVLQVLGGLFSWALSGAAAILAKSEDGPGALVAAGILAGLGVFQILCGAGLWTLRSYGRVMQMILAGIGLLAIPFGTLIGIAILVYMSKPGVKALFSGKPAGAMTPEELAAIAAVAKYSTATAIIIGVVGVIGSVIALSIVAAIAVPGLLRARMYSNEAAAIQQLHAIMTAEVAYATICGHGGYTDSFAVLAADANSPPGIANLASSAPNGYQYTLSAAVADTAGPLDCHGKSTRTTWYATAVPVTFNTNGTRSFAVNQTLVIWERFGGTAPTEPFGPPAVAVSK